MKRGFTLIELLIVVAIIAILAAIAVPNFLEAQTRAKVSRVQADLRSITTGVEMYRIDHPDYPEGTDNPANYHPEIEDLLTPLGLQKSYYGFRLRGAGGLQVGRDFHGITTPIAYITSIPNDPFVKQISNWTYCYRNAKAKRNGFVITSIGPDGDHISNNGKGSLDSSNPLSSFHDSRLGDISERAVIHYIEQDHPSFTDYGNMRNNLTDLTYDATNGTLSDGDIYRIGPGQ